MAKKHNQTGRSTSKPPYVMLPWYVMDTPAWKHLGHGARAAYLEIIRCWNGANNGGIILSVRKLAERLNCSHGSAAIYLRELNDLGFVDFTHIGSFSRRNRLASEFRVTFHRCDKTGQKPSKRFMEWEPSLSSQPDRKVKPVRQSKQNCAQGSSNLDRNAKKPPAIGLTSNTHLDITIGSETLKIEKQSKFIRPPTAKIIPFRAVDEMPELPPFLDRRGGGAQR